VVGSNNLRPWSDTGTSQGKKRYVSEDGWLVCIYFIRLLQSTTNCVTYLSLITVKPKEEIPHNLKTDIHTKKKFGLTYWNENSIWRTQFSEECITDTLDSQNNRNSVLQHQHLTNPTHFYGTVATLGIVILLR
jgi:hypothetical protein